MTSNGFFGFAGLTAAAFALSGCLSGGGGTAAVGPGGGGAGGGGTAGFQAGLDRVSGAVPTSDMRTSGSASYRGQVQVDVTGRTAGQPSGTLTGDLAVDVDFLPANLPDTDGRENVSGSAGNFVLTRNGTDTAIPGTLTTAASTIPSVARSTETSTGAIQVPGLPPIPDVVIRPGAFAANYAGDLDFSGVGGEAATGTLLTSSAGVFTGSGGTGIHGAAALLARGPGNGAGPDLTGNGFYYLEEN